ncbi:MAG TPA: tetratricopeptide repeat protein [Drouetiella sp.]
MTTNTDLAGPLPKSRRTMRLLMLLCGALLLVSLPVIPFASLGDKLPPLPTMSQLAEDGNRMLNNLVPMVMGTIAPQTPRQSASQELKSLDQASDQLLDQINKTPSDPSLHNRVAMIYAGMGDFTSAVSHFEKAVEASRSQILLLTAQEKDLRAKGNKAAAAKTVLDVSKLNVELAAAHSSLARVYGELGQHEKVVAELDALNKDIAFGSGLAKKPETIAVTETVSDHRLNQKTLASLARAQALMQAHRFPEAMQEYRNVIAAEPQSAIAHERLGLAALFVNNSYLAVQELETATRLEPDHSSTHNALGLAYQAEGDGPHAQAEFEKALSLNPKDAEAAFNLGTIFAGTGRYGPAEEAFKKAVAANPKAPMAHNHLGTLLSLSGNYRQAVQEFQAALSLAPDLASSHYGLGLALYNLKDYSSSIREFKRALALNPGLSDAHNKIELAYRKSGLASVGGVN